MKGASFGAADKSLLPEGRVAGPMPWVIAIMMFLSVLAAAAGLGLGSAAGSIEGGNRITIQIVEADEESREAQTAVLLSVLRKEPGLASVRRVDQGELRALLEPWLGAGAMEGGIPIPAMIEADLSLEGHERLDDIRAAIVRAAPAARVDDNAQWLSPLRKLVTSLRWLAAGVVLLMVGATAATVILAARASLDTHHDTIEVLHLMGATDRQVAWLFQRRIALDALFGSIIGFAAAALILWAIGERVSALGSELIGSAALPPAAWLALGSLPVGGVVLAMLVARVTILRALNRLL